MPTFIFEVNRRLASSSNLSALWERSVHSSVSIHPLISLHRILNNSDFAYPWELIFNPLTPRVKPWVIQSFLTFDSVDRTLKCDHSLESC